MIVSAIPILCSHGDSNVLGQVGDKKASELPIGR